MYCHTHGKESVNYITVYLRSGVRVLAETQPHREEPPMGTGRSATGRVGRETKHQRADWRNLSTNRRHECDERCPHFGGEIEVENGEE